jgi:hypothetical protein
VWAAELLLEGPAGKVTLSVPDGGGLKGDQLNLELQARASVWGLGLGFGFGLLFGGLKADKTVPCELAFWLWCIGLGSVSGPQA